MTFDVGRQPEFSSPFGMQLGWERGFTVIELIVVVLVIAILLAIAIPTLRGARARAQDRHAHSNLRNALTTQRAIFAARSGKHSAWKTGSRERVGALLEGLNHLIWGRSDLLAAN